MNLPHSDIVYGKYSDLIRGMDVKLGRVRGTDERVCVGGPGAGCGG